MFGLIYRIGSCFSESEKTSRPLIACMVDSCGDTIKKETSIIAAILALVSFTASKRKVDQVVVGRKEE